MPEHMDQSSVAQNRRSRRANVLLAATVEAACGELSVRLRNMSSDGALIEADELPEKGEQILFRRNDIAVTGRVAWVLDGHAGLSFDSKLDPEVVLRNVPPKKPKIELKFRRPGVTARTLSREEQQFIKLWL
jgi:hypothetical protein